MNDDIRTRETIPPPPGGSTLSEYESLHLRLDSLDRSHAHANDSVSRALADMAQGFEHMCQRMDDLLDKWTAAADRQLALVQMQDKQRLALVELSDRVTALEVKNRQRRRVQRLKEQA